MSNSVFITSAVRTPIGKFNGSLSTLSATELGISVVKEAIQRSNIDPSMIDELIMGQVLLTGQGQNPARKVSILSNMSINSSAWTLNCVCGSGLMSVYQGYQKILLGEADIVICGGQESMSKAYHYIDLRTPSKINHTLTYDTILTDGLTDNIGSFHMGITAENIAKKFNISRIEQDKYAFLSHQKSYNAQQKGIFHDEIVPINLSIKKEKIIFQNDEHIKGETSLESLANLKPAFDKNGTVTAGNSSGINDGAAVVILASEKKVKELNLLPMARIVSFATAGIEPEIMGIAPVYSSKKALTKANWRTHDIQCIEANEAFAAQACAVNKIMEWDTNLVNVNGGAIALGHPIGASGCRILVSLVHELLRSKKNKGLATLCVGGGLGISTCIERYK